LACLGIFVVLAVIGNVSSENTGRLTPTLATLEPEKTSCNAKEAEKLVEDLIEKRVLRSMRTQPSVPKITVDDVWFTLDFEMKKVFDNAVLCYLANGYTSRVPLIAYLDPYTGKKVAQSGPRGFSME